MMVSDSIPYWSKKLPPLRGICFTIYMESIMGSGERFAVIVAAVTETDYKIYQSIRPGVITAMYGDKAENFQAKIDVIFDSLEDTLKCGGSIALWNCPFKGADVGSISDRADYSLDGMINQSIKATASLAALIETGKKAVDE